MYWAVTFIVISKSLDYLHNIIPIIGVPFDAFTKVRYLHLSVSILWTIFVKVAFGTFLWTPFFNCPSVSPHTDCYYFLAAQAGLRMLGFLMVIGTITIGMAVMILFSLCVSLVLK